MLIPSGGGAPGSAPLQSPYGPNTSMDGRGGHDRHAGVRARGARLLVGRLRADLPQGLQDGRGGVDELEAAAADRLRREPVGSAGCREVREQPGVVVVWLIPVVVDAGEQVRRLVVQA